MYFNMVPREGLEPPHLAVPEPKSGASANFATGAIFLANIYTALKAAFYLLVPPTRIELVIIAYQATVIPFNYRG
jgi:hypothetical protein